MSDLGAEGQVTVPDLLDPSRDVCLNCGHTRSQHQFTRGGPRCVNGRRFKLDREKVRALLKDGEREPAPQWCPVCHIHHERYG